MILVSFKLLIVKNAQNCLQEYNIIKYSKKDQ